jgi:1-aminocyclopropane-1-carboxylate synthase
MAYFEAVIKLSQRLWSPEDPEGNIVMSIAENRLTVDMIRDKVAAVSNGYDDSLFFYDAMNGSERLRKALAGMLMDTFMKGLTVDHRHITVSAGCGAIIDNITFAITQPGDGVLIPAPYYPAFDNDLAAKNDAVPVPVQLSATDQPWAQQLTSAKQRFDGDSGRAIKGLLVTNPDNPTGTSYSRQHLQEMLQWCLDNNVHYISDEVYANSMFGDDPFCSIAAVAADGVEAGMWSQEQVDTYVHVVFGLSKDWCASGIRVGCLHSCNRQLNSAMGNLAYFCSVSGLAQFIVARMLEDGSFVDSYLAENKRRLRQSYEVLADSLSKAGITFQPAVASVFCWVDLRHALPEPTWEAERELWHDGFVERCGLIITPGHSCHAPEPGFFRVCYAIVDPVVIPKLVKRIKDFIDLPLDQRRALPVRSDVCKASAKASTPQQQHMAGAMHATESQAD